MNCEDITQAIVGLTTRKDEARNKTQSLDTKEVDSIKQELESIRTSLETYLEPYEIRLTDEEIRQTQEYYDWLDIPIDIKKEYEAGNIVLPTLGQKKLGNEYDYNILLIVPPHKYDELLYIKVRNNFKELDKAQASEFFPSRSFGIVGSCRESTSHCMSDEDIRFVGILVNGNGIDASHLDTRNQTAKDIVNNMYIDHYSGKRLNLSGYSMSDYLILQSAITFRYKGFHPDNGPSNKTFLLQEKTSEGSLSLGHYDNGNINIENIREDYNNPDVGARFCIYPESITKGQNK